MAHRFVAFINASGDEGYNIVPWPDRKSSEWLLLGAAVIDQRSIERLERIVPKLSLSQGCVRLAFLVNRQHDGMGGRIDIEPDDGA